MLALRTDATYPKHGKDWKPKISGLDGIACTQTAAMLCSSQTSSGHMTQWGPGDAPPLGRPPAVNWRAGEAGHPRSKRTPRLLKKGLGTVSFFCGGRVITVTGNGIGAENRKTSRARTGLRKGWRSSTSPFPHFPISPFPHFPISPFPHFPISPFPHFPISPPDLVENPPLGG